MVTVAKPLYRSRVMVALEALEAKQKPRRKGDKVQAPSDVAADQRLSVEKVKAGLRKKAKPAAKKKARRAK